MMTRTEALTLLQNTGMEPSLLHHSLAAEAVLRALAAKLGQDADLWGITGLLHDHDYPETQADPERHGLVCAEKLADQLPEEALKAIRAHNAAMNGSTPETVFDYALRCGETVTGLVTTAALVRPTGIDGMKASSLKKKMKDKAFAASVSRENIRECEKLGLELGEFLDLSISAMTPLARAIGLNKNVSA